MNLIQEYNEFTWDMVRGLPKAYNLYLKDISFQIHCKPGLKTIYSPFCNEVFEYEKFNGVNDNSTYNHIRPDFTYKEWAPPPLKELYKQKYESDKPTIVIQNKYTVEWGQGIYNYFSLEVLDILFSLLKGTYNIVYIRPEGNSKGYFKDENVIEEFQDYEFINEKHPDITLFRDLLDKNPNIDYNTLQFMVEASSERHITTSGGNACVAAYFGGDVIIYDSPQGAGAGRGIWKTDSWLKLLGGANIYGVNDYVTLIDKVTKLWIS